MKINYILKTKFHKIGLSPGFKKYFLNTGWLLFNNIFGMVISLFVGVYVARYLGPNNYGLFNYAGSFVGLFSAIAALGLDNIVARELIKDEKKRDELLGTTFFLKIIGSILVLIIIVIAVRFTNNDSFTNLLIFIIAIGTIFQSFDVIQFYFQSRVLSKYTVYAQIFATILCSVIKLLLIHLNMGLIYFAMVTLLQSIILASGFVAMYIKQKLNLFSWRPKLDLAKKILSDSWPLIFSGIAISIYMKTDQVMIKNILDAKAVGNYAVAVKLSEVWYFIPMAITNSLFPAIINAKKISEKLYYERLQKLYDLMTWLAIGIALPIMFFSNDIINLLFGIQYQEAVGVLRIYIWAGVSTFLGVASFQYLLVENYIKISFLITLFGAIFNVILNIILIPRYGINGAAIATVISYFISTFSIMLVPKTYINSVLMLKSFSPIGCIKRVLVKSK